VAGRPLRRPHAPPQPGLHCRRGPLLEDRGARWIEGFVRLKPGISPAQAQAEVSAVAQRLEAAYPATNRGRGIRLYPLWQTPFNNAGTLLPTLGVTLAVSVSVLLIVCANVSNLLLVRSFGRRREITIRLAIGSARRRIVQQFFTESLILSTLAAAGGFYVAWSCRNLFFVLLPARGGIAPFLPGDTDWRVFLLSSGICLASTLLFGLVPALQTGTVDLAAALRSEGGSVIGGGSRARLRSGLVVLQVALSFVLLVGACPRDPLAFGAALFVTRLAALAASILPAWRATRVDPVRALRMD